MRKRKEEEALETIFISWHHVINMWRGSWLAQIT